MRNRTRYVIYHQWGDEGHYYVNPNGCSWYTCRFWEGATRYKSKEKAQRICARLPNLPFGYQWYVEKVTL